MGLKVSFPYIYVYCPVHVCLYLALFAHNHLIHLIEIHFSDSALKILKREINLLLWKLFKLRIGHSHSELMSGRHCDVEMRTNEQDTNKMWHRFFSCIFSQEEQQFFGWFMLNVSETISYGFFVFSQDQNMYNRTQQTNDHDAYFFAFASVSILLLLSL